MRKILCMAALLGFINHASAQNIFPTAVDTKVGIGTITPAEQLEVLNPTTGAIRISSLKTQLLSNDVIGRLDFYKVDASTGGAGVATSIQSRSFDLGGAFDMDFVTGSISTPVNAMTLHWNGNVGIGTNNPLALFHLNGINTILNSRGNAFISTTDAAAIDAGGQLSFGGSYTGTTQTYWTAIAGRKENATDADYAGYLQFSTRKNAGSLLERMRLTSDGSLGIGTTTPGLKTHINGITGFPATTGTAQTGVLRLQGLSNNAVLDFGVNGVSGAYLQTTNQTALNANYPLLFNPNGGNVGIGTTTPATAFHVSATSAVPGFSNITVENPGATGNESAIAFKGGYTTSSLNSGRIYSLFDGGTSYNNARTTIQSMLPGGIYDNTLTVKNGNVGVGTVAPIAKLASVSTTEQLRLAYDGSHYTSMTTGSGGSFSISPNGGDVATIMNLDFPGLAAASGQVRLFRNSTSTGPLALAIYAGNGSSTSNTYLSANGSSFINANAGNVGIGTTDTKGYKLAVNGGVIATAVTVKLYSEWADYVFDKDYKLPALSQVRAYIDKNHHLPDMPSAKEVKDNGLNLGEINAILTKKVEELTLYLIEENKKNAEQKELIQMQEMRLQKLEKLISAYSKK
jgi:hypothetical protein